MKIIKIASLFFLGLVLLFNASCSKDQFTAVNVNQNAPDSNSVTPSILLTTIEGSVAYTQGGDMSRFASMFMQQTYGYSRQSQAYYQYIFTSQDVDGLWGNLYTSIMQNNVKLMTLSDKRSYNEYSGISRVLMAYALQIGVDNFGSMPYSYAFGGMSNMQSKYDADKVLYSAILSMCDSAITLLNMTKAGFLTPSNDDILYGGDASKWIKFAHAIKARIYIHQSKNNTAMATSAIAEIAQSFASNSDGAIYAGFAAASNGNNPWYQFNNNRGDISFAMGTMPNNMLGVNDPRYSILVDTTTADGGDYLGGYYGGNPDAPVEFITYEELQFINAEAIMRTSGSLVNAQASFQAGIGASMAKLGVASSDAAAYIAAQGTLASATAIQQIANEEYVALYLNPEAWTLWRRTGYPQLTPTKTGASVPRRLLYPQSEYSYNVANTPKGSTLYTPLIFWDN